jgi:subtilase family serine protease
MNKNLVRSCQATTTAIAALESQQKEGSAYNSAIAWLALQSPVVAEEMAWQLEYLPSSFTSPTPIRLDLASLTSGRGWSTAPGYEPEGMDTVWALNVSGSSDPFITQGGLFFLQAIQHADGGWGFGDNDSSTFLSAQVLEALVLVRDSFDLEETINRALTYLSNQAQANGEVGSGLIETAIAYRASILAGVDVGAAFPATSAFLSAAQLPDGSWEEDVYTTAIVLTALSKEKPNLVVTSSSISFSGPAPIAGQTLWITAKVENRGPVAAANVKASFFDGDPALGGVPIGAEQEITSAPPYVSQSVSVAWNTTGKIGVQKIFVIVDPANEISELNEDDNIGSNQVVVISLPDLALANGDISVTPKFPNTSETVTVTATIRNLGQAAAGAFDAVLYDGQPETGGRNLGTVSVPSVAGGDEVHLSWQGNFLSGPHQLYVLVDPDNVISEVGKTNNQGTASLYIYPVEGNYADLATSAIVVSPSAPNAGQSATITATVSNIGTLAAPISSVELWARDEHGAESLLLSQGLPALGIGGQAKLELSATFSQGRHTLTLGADLGQLVTESDRTNNSSSISLNVLPAGVQLPDLAVFSEEILVLPAEPTSEDLITVKATVHNLGNAETNGALVRIYDGDPGSGGLCVGVGRALGLIPSGGEEVVFVDVRLGDGIHTVFVDVDRDYLISEVDETNNQASVSLTVRPPLPDLIASMQDISFSPLFPKAGDTITIQATVRNNGNKSASDVTARLYDGPAESGTLLSETVVPVISGHSWVSFQVSGSFALGDHHITLVIDPADTVLEQSETNNSSSNLLTVLTIPDLSIAFAEGVLDPAQAFSDEKITLRIPVHNLGQSSAEQVEVAFYDGDPTQGGVKLGESYTIYKNYGLSTVQLEKSFFLTPGAHQVYVALDPGNKIVESTKTNNIAAVSVPVQERPDLSFIGAVSIYPTVPAEGGQIEISVLVHNGSSQVVNNMAVAFYDGSPQGGGTQIGVTHVISSLGGNGDVRVAEGDTLSGGYHEIYVVIDPGEEIAESNKQNNTAMGAVLVPSALSDLTIKKAGFTNEPHEPEVGTPVTLRTDVWNYGSATQSGVTVSYYDGESTDGILLGAQTVVVPAGGKTTCEVQAAMAAGDHAVSVVVDPDNGIAEANEANNRQVVRFKVRESAGFYDDCGNSTNEPHTIQWTDVTLSGLATGLAPEVYTACSNPGAVKLWYTGLDRDAVYRITAVFVEEANGGRRQRAKADGVEIIAPFDVPDDKPTALSAILPRDTYRDGAVTLSFELVSGPSVLVSQVWLVRDTGRKEAAISEGNAWLSNTADYSMCDTCPSWTSLIEPYTMPTIFDAYSSCKRTDDPKYEIVMNRLIIGQSPDGSWGENCGATARAVISLREAGLEKLSPTVVTANGWLKRQVNPDGGWGERAGFGSNPATTGIVLMALLLGGESPSSAMISGGAAWLKSVQNASGYWGALPGDSDNAHVGPWPAIGLYAATSAADPSVKTALTRFREIAGGSLNYTRMWGFLLRLYYYCGGTSSEISDAILNIHLRQSGDGGWVDAYERFARFSNSSDIMGALCKFEQTTSAQGIGFQWIGNHISASGGFTNLIAELGIPESAYVLTAMANSGNIASQTLLQGDENNLAGNLQVSGNWGWLYYMTSYHTEPSGVVLEALASTPYSFYWEGVNIPAAQDFLLYWQNADGGWPIYPRNQSNVPSTNLILAGLLKSGISATSPSITRGVTWLLGKQGADGGWGNAKDTARALIALEAENLHTQEIKSSVSWLKANQNVDGGWGSKYLETSLVQETALSVIALSGAGEKGIEIGRGAEWLMAAQNADGGWGVMVGVPSDTTNSAHAIWALAVAQYNLGVNLEVIFNKPWYYPADLVSMAVNPLNKTVNELELAGWVKDQYGTAASLPTARGSSSFSSEYLVPYNTYPGVNTVSFVATSDDAQGSVASNFIVRDKTGILSDLSVSAGEVTLSRDPVSLGETVTISAVIHNHGLIDAQNVAIRFYQGDPSSGGLSIGSDLLLERVAGEGSRQVSMDWIVGAGARRIFVVIDPDNGLIESREDNNSASQWIHIDDQVPRPDLQVTATDMTLQPTAPFEGDAIAVSAMIHNTGGAPCGASVVRFYDADPRLGGHQIGQDITLLSLDVGGQAVANSTLDTTGLAGRAYIYVAVDPDNDLDEVTETNNQAFAFVDLRPLSLPDIIVSQSGLSITPSSVMEGDAVSIAAQIQNHGLPASDVEVAFYDGDPAMGGSLIAPIQVIPGILGWKETKTVSVSWESTGRGGSHQLFVVADPAGSILEYREDNNAAQVSTQVMPANLAVRIYLDQVSYPANTDVPIHAVATNNSAQTAVASLIVTILDSTGRKIVELANVPLSLAAGASRPLDYRWNTGATPDGSYSVSASLVFAGRTAARDYRSVAILPDLRVTSTVATDKVLYHANETAHLSWRVRNGSANHNFSSLTAVLTLADPSGATIFTDSRILSSLTCGQLVSFSSYWGTALSTPGSYALHVLVKDGASVITEVAGTLLIAEGVDPAILLSGSITVERQTVFSGDTESIWYMVRNIGNRDLSQVRLSIKVVSTDQQTLHAELTDTAALAMGSQYASSQMLSTTGLNAADYLAVLVAEIDGVSATLGGTYFRIQGAPSAPSVNSPSGGSKVATFTPALIVSNSADPNALDKLTYFFDLYADSGLTQLVASAGPVAEGQGATGWQVPLPLAENTRYWWRCRAYDTWAYSEWMSPASFFVDTVNDPPGEPTADHPLDGQSVAVLEPLLVVKDALDPDTDSLTYNFLIATDPSMTNIVASAVGVFETPGTTAWQVNMPLAEDTWYWWSAQADDWLIEGPWMNPVSFFVNTADDAPTAPVPISPAEGAVTGSAVTLEVQNATDPDSLLLTYVFEVDTDSSFTTAGLMTSPSLPEGASTTAWTIFGTLTENTRYYWRAKASDGEADGPWSAVPYFFVNEVNEPPSTPSLANPSDGGEVILLQPALMVHNAVDPDGDALTYEFEVYTDAGLAQRVVSVTGIAQGTGGLTSWSVTLSLSENTRYWWRTRAHDSALYSAWMPAASFFVNIANDPPSAPVLVSPASGASVALLQPELAVTNAVDPEGVPLTYQFEVYCDASLTALAASVSGIGAGSGSASWVLSQALQDNQQYWWRCRAFDGDRYGPWMATATFTVHVSSGSLTATIDFDPDTLNLGSVGTWVTVYVELPAGYNVRNISPTTVKLNGLVPAETKPVGYGDEDKDGIPDVMFKFRRSAVEAILAPGEHVVVKVTGKVGSADFEGIDIIRVINR